MLFGPVLGAGACINKKLAERQFHPWTPPVTLWEMADIDGNSGIFWNIPEFP